MTSPTLLCSQQGHRHQPLMLNEGLGGVCDALRCLWMSKAWEAHSAGLCAPSEVWWRPPMDLRRAAADETPRRALTGGSGSDSVSDVTFASRQQWLLSSVTQRPDHSRSTDSTFPWRYCGDSACLPLEHNYTKHWSKLNFPAVISACTFLCSPSLEALALPRFITFSLSLHPSDPDGGNVCGARRLQRPPRLFASGCSRLRTKPSGFIYVRLCSRTL